MLRPGWNAALYPIFALPPCRGTAAFGGTQLAKPLRDLCGGSFKDKAIGVLGVTFKPNTDDMRDAQDAADAGFTTCISVGRA